MDDLTPLLNAIDAAHRMAVRANQNEVAKLLLMASLGVSQKIEAPKQKAG